MRKIIPIIAILTLSFSSISTPKTNQTTLVLKKMKILLITLFFSTHLFSQNKASYTVKLLQNNGIKKVKSVISIQIVNKKQTRFLTLYYFRMKEQTSSLKKILI